MEGAFQGGLLVWWLDLWMVGVAVGHQWSYEGVKLKKAFYDMDENPLL